jgi:hypothetical protein
MNRFTLIMGVLVIAAGMAGGLTVADEKKDLLTNGGFEKLVNDQPVGWIWGAEGGEADVKISKDRPKEGKQSLRITGNAAWAAAIATDRVTIERGKTYVLTGYARAPRGQAMIKFDYFNGDQHVGQTFTELVQGTDDWQKVTVRSETASYPTATHLAPTVAILGDADGYFDGLTMTAE